MLAVSYYYYYLYQEWATRVLFLSTFFIWPFLRFQIISYTILTFVCISCCLWIINLHNNPMEVEIEK